MARALLIAGNSIEDKAVSEWAFHIIEEKAKCDISDYNLISPTLCHGYAGVLSVFTRTLCDCESIYIKNQIVHLKNKIEMQFAPSSKYGFPDVEIRSKDGRQILTKTDTNKFLIGASGVILALLSTFHNDSLLDSHLLI